MKNLIFMIMMSVLFLPVSLALAADVPMMLNYQGYVEDSTGTPLDGPAYFKFAIVNAAGDTTYWSNDGTSTTGNEPNNAVTIPATNGFFTLKLGNTDITNMTGLDTTPFDHQNIYVRVWFSEDNVTFEQLTPDTQIVSAGFAYKAQTAQTAQTVAGGVSWSELSGIPSDFADDVDNVGITSESDPTVPASVKDGVSWSELSDIPPGFADKEDNVGITSESDPTVPASVKDGVSWSELSDIPIGFADDIDNTGDGGGLWTQSGSNIYYNTGNVGIGTSNTESILNIGGDHTISANTSDGSDSAFLMLNGGGDSGLNRGASIALHGNEHINGGTMWFRVGYDPGTMTGQNEGDLIIETGGQQRMRIDIGGNVGIGTTSPGTKLAVVGLSGTTSGSYMRYLTDGTGRVFYYSSSARYKEDIQPLKDDFNKIFEAEPKSFIDKVTGERNIGYIAEEFDALGLNNLVGYKDGKPDSIKYELICLYLLEVMKDQKRQIDELKTQLNTKQ